jgi:hypothetical protein
MMGNDDEILGECRQLSNVEAITRSRRGETFQTLMDVEIVVLEAGLDERAVGGFDRDIIADDLMIIYIASRDRTCP